MFNHNLDLGHTSGAVPGLLAAQPSLQTTPLRGLVSGHVASAAQASHSVHARSRRRTSLPAQVGRWSRPCSNGIGKGTVQPGNANSPIAGTRDLEDGLSTALLGDRSSNSPK